jgi:hypothetical protein
MERLAYATALAAELGSGFATHHFGLDRSQVSRSGVAARGVVCAEGLKTFVIHPGVAA